MGKGALAPCPPSFTADGVVGTPPDAFAPDGFAHPTNSSYGSERNLQPAVAVEVVAALACKGLRHIRRQRDIVPHRRHDAGGHPAVDIARTRIRDRPVVDDERGRGRAELHDASVSDEVVIRRQVHIRADDLAADPERKAELRADAADQRLGGLLADIQRQHRIAGFGVAVHLGAGVEQAADRADLELVRRAEQIADLAGRNDAGAVGFEVIMSTTPGRTLR